MKEIRANWYIRLVNATGDAIMFWLYSFTFVFFLEFCKFPMKWAILFTTLQVVFNEFMFSDL